MITDDFAPYAVHIYRVEQAAPGYNHPAGVHSNRNGVATEGRVKNRSGFALVDLLIVTALLAGIGAVALPSLLAGGRLTNEREAILHLRVITTA